MRSFLIGMVVLVFFTVTILSFRPGGLRRQLRFAARRMRLAIILGGVYIVASTVIRLAAPEGPLADWGPPGLALALAGVFAILGQDPRDPARDS